MNAYTRKAPIIDPINWLAMRTHDFLNAGQNCKVWWLNPGISLKKHSSGVVDT